MAEIFSNYFMLRVQCCAHNKRRMAHSISSFGPVATEMLRGEQHQFWTWLVRFWLLPLTIFLPQSGFGSCCSATRICTIFSVCFYSIQTLSRSSALSLSHSCYNSVPLLYVVQCNSFVWEFLFVSPKFSDSCFFLLGRAALSLFCYCFEQSFLYYYFVTVFASLHFFFCDTRKRQKH